MKFGSEMQRSMRWCALWLIFSGVGLSIFGAFLGAERAKEFFTSAPLVVYWGVFALTLVAGFVVFARMRRDLGLAAMHLGFLLIMVGFAMGSGAGHRWAARAPGGERIPWSYLPIRVGATTRTVWDRALRRDLGRLPFAVRLDAFEIEHYPPSAEPPPLFLGALAHAHGASHGNWQAQPLKWKPGRAVQLPGTPIRMRVLEFTTPDADVPLSVRVALDAGGEPREETLVCAAGAPFARLALSRLFPELRELDPTASLLLAPPAPAARTYRSRVTVFEDGRERSAEILVNRPLRVAGYHLYQHSWGEQPELHSILLVVSDRGLNVVYAGFVLLGAGPILLYGRPRRRAAA